MKVTQCERVLEYLVRFGSISSAQAMDDLGCFRLASRICDLKKKGYKITDEWDTKKNRFGEEVRFKRYRLEA